MKPALEVKNVSKKFFIGSSHGSLRDTIPGFIRKVTGKSKIEPSSTFWALRDVSFRVEHGECVGIIGHNGAGKSTMLKLLSKISRQTEGEININGRLAALIEVGAGFHPDLTGRENIYLNGTIMGLRRKEIDELFDDIVEFSELGQFLEMPVKRYSSGMSVRLGFAVAAHVNPEILLVDEVLAVGDLSFQQKCYKRILDLKESGTTIVFISHNLEAVHRLCERVILMEKGQVVTEGDPEPVILRYRQDVLRNRKEQLLSADKKTVINQSDNDIQVEKVELFNGVVNEPTDAFETGKGMKLKAHYKVNRPIENPSVVVTIERLDGVICHEASSRHADLTWPQWSTAGCFELDYKELNLLPNTYQVKLRVYEDRNPAPLDTFANKLYFHVSSDKHARGTVHLDHAWNQGS